MKTRAEINEAQKQVFLKYPLDFEDLKATPDEYDRNPQIEVECTFTWLQVNE